MLEVPSGDTDGVSFDIRGRPNDGLTGTYEQSSRSEDNGRAAAHHQTAFPDRGHEITQSYQSDSADQEPEAR